MFLSQSLALGAPATLIRAHVLVSQDNFTTLTCLSLGIHGNTARPSQAESSQKETAGVLLQDVEQMRVSTHPIPLTKETAKAFVILHVHAFSCIFMHFLEPTVLSIWCSPECSESCLNTKNRECIQELPFTLTSRKG